MLATELLTQFVSDTSALARRQVEADRVISASLAGHLVHHELDGGAQRPNRPWRLDPVPLVLEGAEFDQLAAAVRQRMRGMEALLNDLYGPRLGVRDGLVPGEALASSGRYPLSAVGAPQPPRWLTTYAVDVMAIDDGSWRVVQDLSDTPTGVGYALLDRSVMARVAAELLGPEGAGDLASISGFAAELRHALASTTDASSPRIVLLSGGVDDAAYVEHSALAQLLGFHLVQAHDLVVRSGRLWLRTLGGLEPVDVVYRRLDDAGLDPIDAASTTALGVPGMVLAAAEGGVTLANAHGSGVLEDVALARHWPGAIARLTGETLSLRDLHGTGGEPMMRPAFRDGRVGVAPVIVRLHAVAGHDEVVVMTGGNGRVLAPGDDPRRPTARVAKDVWVLGAGRAAPVVVAPPLPQVDLAASVPTRAADAMYWLGRASERAEAIARTVRVVAARRQEDPSLVTLEGGRWAHRMASVLCVARGGTPDHDAIAVEPVAALDHELASASRAVGERLGELVAEAATVGEYLSVTTGRVLGSLATLRSAFAEGGAPIDALDEGLADLASLAGLWNESVVRGPAWRFGDIGRRVERSLVVLGLVEACLGPSTRPAPADGSLGATDIVEASTLEILLAANESLVAYRRHHRSDVELDAAMELLLHSADNPRSFAASTRRLAEHVLAIEWPEGVAAVAAIGASLPEDRPLDHLDRAHDLVVGFGQRLVETWFATPVNPVVVHGSLT